jgi:hypothetical protein
MHVGGMDHSFYLPTSNSIIYQIKVLHDRLGLKNEPFTVSKTKQVGRTGSRFDSSGT